MCLSSYKASEMPITKQTKESTVRLGLQIEHLQVSVRVISYQLSGNRPAGSDEASIELLRTSPVKLGDSVVGVALI